MVKEELERARLKRTGPRLNILKLLEDDSNKHLSAEDILQLLRQDTKDVSLATVYRALGQFEAAGIVVRHKFGSDTNVYELNRGEHHDHLICVGCNKVVEFVDELIEDRQAQIAKRHGFSIQDHSLNIFGVCADCASDLQD